ncbi:MAG TPA: ADOP family duplicated permease [Gemmatimonadaceae bacterium]|nr:ADOP family duplicated permease [Gemmatimonadaceae bacterium]
MSLLADIRYALRTFRREPTFVAGIVLTFGLVIGTNAAMFGLVRRLMLAPPPGVQDAERVVRVATTLTVNDGSVVTMETTSYPAFRDLAALDRAFDAIAAVSSDSVTTGEGADLAEVPAIKASGQYFAVLGVKAAAGRLFGPSDDALPNGNEVVVLGHAFWQRRFAGERSAVGQQLVVDGLRLTIIGVAPRGFSGTDLAPADLFIPLTTAMRNRAAGWWSDPRIRMVSVVAHLRRGVRVNEAQALALQTLRATLPADGADRLTAVPLESVMPGHASRSTPQARIALWLTGVSVVVLLVATANVGTLLLLRAAKRRREAAVRLSLGAPLLHLARQSIVVSLLLSLVGCVLGLVLAHWIGTIVRVTLMPNVAAITDVIEPTVLAASVAVACGAGLLASLGPIAQLTRRNLSLELRAGGGHGASGRVAYQHALVAVQVAMSVVLLIGAGLFVRSLARVQSQDLGFSTARLIHVTLDFRGPTPGPEQDRALAEAAQRIASLPGVTGVTVVQGMPFSSHNIPPIHVPGYTMPSPAAQQLPIMYAATPAYLDLMGVRLREGRLFTRGDTTGTPLVVLVNETMARTMWPGRSAIGGCVQAGHVHDPMLGDPMSAAALLPCRTVVGVVRDSRARSLRTEGNEARLMQYYVPLGQAPSAPFPNIPAYHGILVRSAGEPERWVTPIQRIIQSTSARPVYARVSPYQSLIDPQLRSWRLGATLFSAFGLLALAIAAVGLFAVVSYVVTQRTREIGVRLALGGSAGGVAGLIVRDAVRMAAVGGVAGIGIALVAAPLVQPVLFETSAREPVVLFGAAIVFLIVTVSAGAVPAWRAGRVSPMVVMRTDS